MIKLPKSPNGDTLVETVLALAILSLVLFTAWGLVNRATQISLAARQRIEMVNQLKEQAEILKGFYAKTYTTNPNDFGPPYNLGAGPLTTTSAASINSNPCDDLRAGNTPGAFYMTVSPAGVIAHSDQTIAPIKQVASTNGSIWVQLVPNPGALPNANYDDFYVRGCWHSTGTQTEENSQVRVRLNL